MIDAMSVGFDRRCPLCGAEDAERVVVGYDRMRATEHDYAYDRCRACGLVSMAPLPHPDDIPAFIKAAENADLVLGTRYKNGIRVINWPLKRLMLSMRCC